MYNKGAITASWLLGRQALEKAAELVPLVGLPWHRGGTLIQMAASRLLLNEPHAALALTDEVIRLAQAENLCEVEARGLWLHGQALLVLDRPGEAEAALARGLAQAKAIGYIWLQQLQKKTPNYI